MEAKSTGDFELYQLNIVPKLKVTQGENRILEKRLIMQVMQYACDRGFTTGCISYADTSMTKIHKQFGAQKNSGVLTYGETAMMQCLSCDLSEQPTRDSGPPESPVAAAPTSPGTSPSADAHPHGDVDEEHGFDVADQEHDRAEHNFDALDAANGLTSDSSDGETEEELLRGEFTLNHNICLDKNGNYIPFDARSYPIAQKGDWLRKMTIADGMEFYYNPRFGTTQLMPPEVFGETVPAINTTQEFDAGSRVLLTGLVADYAELNGSAGRVCTYQGKQNVYIITAGASESFMLVKHENMFLPPKDSTIQAAPETAQDHDFQGGGGDVPDDESAKDADSPWGRRRDGDVPNDGHASGSISQNSLDEILRADDIRKWTQVLPRQRAYAALGWTATNWNTRAPDTYKEEYQVLTATQQSAARTLGLASNIQWYLHRTSKVNFLREKTDMSLAELCRHREWNQFSVGKDALTKLGWDYENWNIETPDTYNHEYNDLTESQRDAAHTLGITDDLIWDLHRASKQCLAKAKQDAALSLLGEDSMMKWEQLPDVNNRKQAYQTLGWTDKNWFIEAPIAYECNYSSLTVKQQVAVTGSLGLCSEQWDIHRKATRTRLWQPPQFQIRRPLQRKSRGGAHFMVGGWAKTLPLSYKRFR